MRKPGRLYVMEQLPMILRTSWLLRPRKYCRTGQGKRYKTFAGIKNAAVNMPESRQSGKKKSRLQNQGHPFGKGQKRPGRDPAYAEVEGRYGANGKKTPMVDSSKVKMPSALKTRRMTFGASRRVIPQKRGLTRMPTRRNLRRSIRPAIKRPSGIRPPPQSPPGHYQGKNGP